MSSYDYSLYYSQFHEKTDAHAESMAAWQRDLIAPYAPADMGTPVLDIGCAYGFALRALRGLGFSNIEGVELSPQQAKVATDAGFKVAVTDDTVAYLHERTGKYGFILLMDVLEHVPVPEQIQLLTAIHAALAPGGRLFLTVPNANAILASRWRYNDFTHHSSFTEHSLDFVLRNAGFDRVEIDTNKGIGRFPRRVWRRTSWPKIRKWLVRWCWLQVFKAELPWMSLDGISFELNLHAAADRA